MNDLNQIRIEGTISGPVRSLNCGKTALFIIEVVEEGEMIAERSFFKVEWDKPKGKALFSGEKVKITGRIREKSGAVAIVPTSVKKVKVIDD